MLRPGGTLVLFSPNRRYPFETHGSTLKTIRTPGAALRAAHPVYSPRPRNDLPRLLGAQLLARRTAADGGRRRLHRRAHRLRLADLRGHLESSAPAHHAAQSGAADRVEHPRAYSDPPIARRVAGGGGQEARGRWRRAHDQAPASDRARPQERHADPRRIVGGECGAGCRGPLLRHVPRRIPHRRHGVRDSDRAHDPPDARESSSSTRTSCRSECW